MSAKVLALCRWYPPVVGGVQTLLAEIYGRQPVGDIHVVAPAEPGAAEFDRLPRSYELTRVGSRVGSDRKGIVGALARTGLTEVRRGSYSQVHCGHVLLAIPALLTSLVGGTPYVVWTFGSDFTTTKFRRARRFLMNRAAAVITISPGMRDELIERGVAAERLVLIPPGVDADVHRPDAEARRAIRDAHGLGDAFLLLSVGRLHPNSRHKGVDTAIAALAVLAETVPTARLVVVGDGPDRERMQGIAEDHGVGDRVHFAGAATDDELRGWYSAADVFVQATRREATKTGYTTEGFGIVFVEAQASGLPVVTGNSGGATYAVGPDSGLLLDAVDAVSLAAAVGELAADPERREAMGAAGRDFAIREFSWSESAGKLGALITKVGAA